MKTELSHFDILETISENSEHQVALAQNKLSGQKVVLKKIAGLETNRESVLFRLKREAEILSSFFSDYVVKLLDVFETPQSLYLVMEYWSEKNLKDTYPRLSLTEKIQAFHATATALEKVHQKDIVHRDLKPDNILIALSGNSARIKIIDFGLAYMKNLSDVFRQGMVVGTLAYLSPEQTGLLKRPVDNRTDLYSLGATFYEVFSGSPPFREKDPLKLIHAHLSSKPPQPSLLNPEIPPVLDEILLKLLAKEPAERYQNAHGLSSDLAKLLENPASCFPLSCSNKQKPLNYNGKAVGRKKEIQALRNFYLEALSGQFKTVIIRGKSGSGKTKFLETFKESLDFTQNLVFQYQSTQDTKNVPLRIFREFFSFFLENPSREKIGKQLKQRFPNKLYLLKNLLPPSFFEKIDLADSPAENPSEKDEFLQLMQQIMLFLIEESQPFVWCLEDFQWADQSSMELIAYLSKNIQGQPFFLLATNRQEEQNEAYFLANPQISILDLKELAVQDIPLLIQSVFNQSESFPHTFYEKIYRDSLGNILYILEIVKTLIQEKIIFWDHAHWKLDEDSFMEYSFDQDMTELIGARLNRFSKNEKTILTTAAIQGKEFSLDLLKLVLRQEQENPSWKELFNVLDKAKKEQIIEEYHFKHNNSYTFTHDKILETLQKNLPPDEREKKHELCARVLENSKNRNDIFQLAYHYNFTRNSSKKIAYNTQAYRQALSQYSLQDAVHYMEHICEEYRVQVKMLQKEKIDFMVQAATTMQKVGQLEKSRELITFLLENLDRDSLRPFQVECFLLLGTYHHYNNELAQALNYYQKAIAEAEKSGQEIRYWRPFFLIGNTCFYNSEYRLSVPNFTRALELLPREDKNNYFTILALRLYSYYFLGEITKGNQDQDYIENHMGEIENPLTLSQLHHTLALCFNWSGNSAKGLTHSLKAFELGEKSGYILSMYGALFSRMLSYFFMEDYGKVSETFEKAKKMSEKNKITLIIEIFFSMAAFTELLQKNFHSLKTILDDFLPYPEKMGNKFAHVVFLYLRAALSFCKNQLTDAEKFLNEAMGIARNRELGITYPWLLSLYSEIYSNIGNRDELEKTTDESRDLRKRLPGLRFMFTHAQKITGKLKNFREEYISELQSQSSVSIFKEKLQLENIVKTSQMISSILDIDKLLDSILQSMLETTGAQRGVLKLDTYQKQETSFILKNISTEDTDFTFIKKTLETSGWQHGGSILAGKELREKGILSAIASPLIIKGKFIGVVYLDSKVINELFTEEEVKLLNIFTSQAAIAIENARTFEDLKQERNNLDLKVQERTQDLVKKNQIIEQRNRQFTDELKLAKAIQQSLIPARPPQFPGIRLASLYKPMEDVGGDFFDFIKVREPNLMGIFISDVSGHGVPAALITSMVKTLVETAGTNRVNPGDLLRYMNDSLTGQTGGNFMTAFYGVYDNKTGILNYARGGHNAPFLIRDDTILNLESRGKILGLMEDLEFEERQILLQAGDRILFYTDGLTEAANARGVEFEEIMPEILTNNESLPADDFLEVLYHSLLSHRGDFLFEDDVCVVVMDVV